MSTEIERRILVLEKKIAVSTSCSHRLPILHNPTPGEIRAMEEILTNCRNCKTPAFGYPRILIFHWHPSHAQHARKGQDANGYAIRPPR
jgi:hypothetical protein